MTLAIAHPASAVVDVLDAATLKRRPDEGPANAASPPPPMSSPLLEQAPQLSYAWSSPFAVAARPTGNGCKQQKFGEVLSHDWGRSNVSLALKLSAKHEVLGSITE
jgi:hypothetical protein